VGAYLLEAIRVESPGHGPAGLGEVVAESGELGAWQGDDPSLTDRRKLFKERMAPQGLERLERGIDEDVIGSSHEGAFGAERHETPNAELGGSILSPTTLDDGPEARTRSRGIGARPVEDPRSGRPGQARFELGETLIEAANDGLGVGLTAHDSTEVEHRLTNPGETVEVLHGVGAETRPLELAEEIAVGELGDDHEVGAQSDEALEVGFGETFGGRGSATSDV
jgi:hypothetical protein